MGADHLEDHKWKKGQSGNPSGRPKGASPKERMRQWLLSDENTVRDAQYDETLPMVDRIAAGMVVKALEAAQSVEDADAIRKYFDSIADRLDGKPTQSVEALVAPLDVVTLEDRREKPKEVED